MIPGLVVEKNKTIALRKALNELLLGAEDVLPAVAAEDAKEAAELLEVSHRSGVAMKEALLSTALGFGPLGCELDLRCIGGADAEGVSGVATPKCKSAGCNFKQGLV